MTAEQIIQDATQNKEIENYNLLDMHLYLVIKQILVMYFNKQISKEQANIQKQKAVKIYEDNKKQYEFENNMFQEHIQNLRDTENARIKLRKLLNCEDGQPVTEEKLCETINTCMEIISKIFKGEFI